MSESNEAAPSQHLDVNDLVDPARVLELPAGTEVRIADRAEVVYSVGRTTATIASILGWTQANVWPRRVDRIRIERIHRPIANVIETTAAILSEPVSVHVDRRQADATYFIIDGATLRERGLLTSRSIRYVDLVVQSHVVHGVMLYRAFHWAPTRRNRGGAQLWP